MIKVDFDSPATQSYLAILQAVISRMASNSTAAKTWCIALVSAVVVVVADKEKPEYIWISAIPIVLFFFLDSHYLALERHFRDRYNGFVKKLQAESADVEDTFTLKPEEDLTEVLAATALAAKSISIWPFYALLLLMLLVVHALVL